MIGPGQGVIGGISSLVQVLLPVLHEHVDLVYLATVRQRPCSQSGKVSLRNTALAISQYLRFAHTLIQFRPQIVHLHTSQGIAWYKDTLFVLMSKASRRRVALHMHGGDFDVLYHESKRLLQSYSRLALNLADAVIEVAEQRRKRLTHIVSLERVSVFRNCIGIHDLLPCHSNRPSDGAKALFLGVIGESKGVFDLLKAMARLKTSGCSLQLWVAGGEEQDGDLAKARYLLKELDIEDVCHLVGIVRGTSKSKLLREASLFVLPSYQEALPMAILEAMATGLPIVATAVGGIPEIVKDGDNGFLVNPGDVEALACKLASLANDQHLRDAMGRRSREIAEQELDVKPYVMRLVALYESLAGI